MVVPVLPLLTKTSTAWAEVVLASPVALLDDHAHLERKAAQNALILLTRWPRDPAPEGGDAYLEAAQTWAKKLTQVAKDEIEHLALVLRLLAARGRAPSRMHQNPYVAALRREVRKGEAARELTDLLLVSALIEARSCERFERLSEVAGEDELRRLYRGLLASERGHYQIFLDLARSLPSAGPIEGRWGELLEAEAHILAAQPPGIRMHGGEPGDERTGHRGV